MYLVRISEENGRIVKKNESWRAIIEYVTELKKDVDPSWKVPSKY